jgi:hypothetical protein
VARFHRLTTRNSTGRQIQARKIVHAGNKAAPIPLARRASDFLWVWPLARVAAEITQITERLLYRPAKKGGGNRTAKSTDGTSNTRRKAAGTAPDGETVAGRKDLNLRLRDTIQWHKSCALSHLNRLEIGPENAFGRFQSDA